MLSEVDVLALMACAVAWLGPLAWNATRGRIRLLHPNGFFCIMIFYMMIPPIKYRLATGGPILLTSELWSGSDWFLGEPMLWLALFGLFYHLGVQMAGVPLKMSVDDKIDALVFLRFRRDIPAPALFIAALVVLGMMVPATMARPLDTLRPEVGKGLYFLHVFFLGYQVLPIVVLAQDRRLGQIFLFVAAPAGLLIKSKVAFLYIAIGLVLFYQSSLLRISKVATAAIVGLVLLTPLAVARYANEVDTDSSGNPTWVSWDDALSQMEHRDYALESFACVFHWRKEGRPWTWGSTLLGEVTDIIPSALWPGKRLTLFDFPSEYLPRDFRFLNSHYARHLATIFFLDFDIPGCCIGFWATGLLFGRCYRRALRLSLLRRENWPMVLNLCWVINAKYLVEGGFRSSVPYTLGNMLGVLMTIAIAALLTSLGRRRFLKAEITPAGGRAVATRGCAD